MTTDGMNRACVRRRLFGRAGSCGYSGWSALASASSALADDGSAPIRIHRIAVSVVVCCIPGVCCMLQRCMLYVALPMRPAAPTHSVFHRTPTRSVSLVVVAAMQSKSDRIGSLTTKSNAFRILCKFRSLSGGHRSDGSTSTSPSSSGRTIRSESSCARRYVSTRLGSSLRTPAVHGIRSTIREYRRPSASGALLRCRCVARV